jgi:hypothetical protein
VCVTRVCKSTETSVGSVDLNQLNTHFSTPPVVLDIVSKSMSLSYLSNLSLPDCPSFIFHPVTVGDVKRSILSISTKAVGTDNFSLDMLLPILDDIVPIITHIMNYSLSNNVFPTE